MVSERAATLLEILQRARGPLSGPELAARLGVSSRMVRSYIAQLNQTGRIVTSGRGGYVASRIAPVTAASTHRIVPVTPDQRLSHLCRSLIQTSEPTSIHELADLLFVSESTLETDLVRVRQMMREHDVSLLRERDLVHAEGPERGKRRLMRQLVYASSGGLIPATWHALIREYADVDVRALRVLIEKVLARPEIELNEFTLNEVLLHLTVTIDRVRRGHVLPAQTDSGPDVDAVLMDVSRELIAAVEQVIPTHIPDPEILGLYNVLVVRNILKAPSRGGEITVDPGVRALVTRILEDVSAKYLLGPAEPNAQLKLALHVQGLLARATSGVPVSRPLGDELRISHPLLHDLAVDFARRLERERNVQVAPGEVDYLALHMGMQYMHYFDQGDLVTITLVVPRYYEMASGVAEKISKAVRDLGVLETVATTVDFDFANVTSDLIVSTIPPTSPTPAPVVVVNTFPTRSDLDLVAAAVRQERASSARRRIRSKLSALLDPDLFVHISTPTTREDALALLADRLQSANYTGERFLEDVLDRERRASTGFDGGFAIPHSIHMDARATAIAPLISEQPIPWGTSRVRLVLLFALSPDGRQAFKDVLDEVTRFLSEGRRVNELIAASADAETFVTTFLDLLDEQNEH